MNEWKGNKHAVRAQKGIQSDYTTSKRNEDDFYATDPYALELLLDHCSSWLYTMFLKSRFESQNKDILKGTSSWWGFSIWECAVGTGNLAKVLKDRGYQVKCSDIKDRGYCKRKGMCCIDFLKTDMGIMYRNHIGIILTNPPFRYANEFIMHALDLLPENGLYIAFMNLTYLAGKERYESIYQFGSLREVYVFPRRVGAWRNNDPIACKDIRMVDYAWFVFQKGYVGACSLYWLYEPERKN